MAPKTTWDFLQLTDQPTPLLLEEKGLGDEVDATKEWLGDEVDATKEWLGDEVHATKEWLGNDSVSLSVSVEERKLRGADDCRLPVPEPVYPEPVEGKG
jgi:hypothetical protein